MPQPLARSFLPLAIALVAALPACKHVGKFTWVDEYQQPPSASGSSAYVIAPGDVLSVRVWNQESMSARARVRADGMISVPFVNDLEVAGMEPAAAAQRLRDGLKDFMVNPVVTIALEEPAPFEVSVLGEVAKAGVYRLDRNAGVLNALAVAGGLNELAGRDRIFVLRHGREPDDPDRLVRIRFRYEALAHAEGTAASFRLRPGDIVVVE